MMLYITVHKAQEKVLDARRRGDDVYLILLADAPKQMMLYIASIF